MMNNDLFKIESVDGTTYYSHDADSLPPKTEEWIDAGSMEKVN